MAKAAGQTMCIGYPIRCGLLSRAARALSCFSNVRITSSRERPWLTVRPPRFRVHLSRRRTTLAGRDANQHSRPAKMNICRVEPHPTCKQPLLLFEISAGACGGQSCVAVRGWPVVLDDEVGGSGRSVAGAVGLEVGEQFARAFLEAEPATDHPHLTEGQIVELE